MSRTPTTPTLQSEFEVTVRLDPMADHGRTRAGHRRVIDSPDRYFFRTTIRIETSSAKLAHLEHAVFVASCIGRRMP